MSNLGVRVFQGPEQFKAATEATLTDPTAHLVVVRNLVGETALQAIQRARSYSEIDGIFRNEVPDLDEVNAIIETWWSNNGYSGYTISDSLRCYQRRGRGKSTAAHVDNPDVVEEWCSGALTLSLGVTGVADWQARRPYFPMINTETGDPSAGRLKQWIDAIERRPRVQPIHLTAETTQFAGDGILFSQHPIPTAHQVMARRMEANRAFLHNRR